MANGEENLISFKERTTEEVREIARKGGIASGEARKEKKKMKDQAELLLSLAVKNPKLKKVMQELGLDEEEQTNQMAMIISVMNKAITKGDVQAFNTLQATIGEKPIEKIEISKDIDETISEVEKYLNSKKEVDGNE